MKKKLNKLFKKAKENKKPLIFLLILTLVGVIGGTLAYYSSESSFENKFETMTYNVDLEENFDGDWGTKEVTILNKKIAEDDNNVPVVIRVNYNEKWRLIDDVDTFVLGNAVNGVDVVTKNWTNAFTNDFVLGSDGWYYYKKVLNSGESVKILDSIEKNTAITTENPDYDDYDYSLDFNYEAVQASSEAIDEVWNKTATINGNDVTWNL